MTSLSARLRRSALALLVLSSLAFGEEPKLDSYGGRTGLQGKKTGFFHLEKLNGRNWFVTPEGNVFFPIAPSHLLTGESDVAATKVFGDDKKAWISDSIEKAKALGFNCALGGATSPERNLNGFVDLKLAEQVLREKKFPFAVGVILLEHPWEFIEGETLPDIFDPAYRQLIEDRAKVVCPPVKDDPLVVGYYYGFGAFNHSEHWVNHHLSLPPNSPGRTALVDLLAKRYKGDVAEFNRVYVKSLKQFDNLKGAEVLAYAQEFENRNFPAIGKTLDPRQLADFEAILSHMCVTLYDMAKTAIQRWDTNHVILGSFIKEWALDGASWKAAAPYIDMIAPQHLNREVSVNALADAAGLPMILSDEDFGFHYPVKGMGYNGVKSHEARGEIYAANLMRLFKDPQVLGVSYCACMYDQGGDTLKKDNQNGFRDINGAPRPTLMETVTKMNHSVYEHTPHPGTPEEVKALNQTVFETWDKYSTKAGKRRKFSRY